MFEILTSSSLPLYHFVLMAGLAVSESSILPKKSGLSLAPIVSLKVAVVRGCAFK